MPIDLSKIGWKMYVLNGSCDIVIVLLIAVFCAETKGKTLDEIDTLFEGHKHSNVLDGEAVGGGKDTIDVDGVQQEISTGVETVEWE